MAKNLVVVESPAKAGTIEKYLGSDYQVIASQGHIRDLPSSKLGVDIEKSFTPTYVIPTKAKKIINALKQSLEGKEKVLLATDLDREGEAIAWHLAQALNLAERPNLQVERITFDEITKSAIQEAVSHPGQINDRLVDAQQARRVLDRLVGYTLSPILWKKIYKGLSAGRVQSVALRLIVDRERERQKFQPIEYWTVKALLQKHQGPPSFLASLIEYRGEKIEQLSIKNEKQALEIIETLDRADYKVSSVEKKRTKRYPAPPYTTSTLQQDAVNKLGFSSKRVMQLAQKLYEAGHITYMRTDSVSLAAAALGNLRQQIENEFGKAYLPAVPRSYTNKSKNAQEAHEAIRPTNPGQEKVTADPSAQRLYSLIRKRAIACQMKEAELEQVGVNITAGPAVFRATGQTIIFPGFLKVWDADEKEEGILPDLTLEEKLQMLEIQKEQHFTEPPPRFSEATLIKTLEEQGIGRPSTYAPTIDTLLHRRYVRVEQKRFIPEEVGYLVTDLLEEHFPQIVDTGFTADMEENLDLIAEGGAGYADTIAKFWEPFHRLVEENTPKINKVDLSEETSEVCPNCQAPMLVKMGRFGKFLACSRFPECKTTLPIQSKEPSGLICPACGKSLIERRSRRSVFYGCSGYPDCQVAVWKKEHMLAKIKELEQEGKELPFKDESIAAFQALGIEPVEPKPKAASKNSESKKPNKKKGKGTVRKSSRK